MVAATSNDTRDLDRIHPLPPERHRVTMRPIVANDLNVPGYAGQHRRLGRSSLLEPMWAAWAGGDAVGEACDPASVAG